MLLNSESSAVYAAASLVNRKAALCSNPHETFLRHGLIMDYSLTRGGGQTFSGLGNATNLAICNLANTVYIHRHRHGFVDYNA